MSEIKVNQISPRTGVDVKIKSDTVTFENVAGTTSTSIAIESIVPVGCIQMYAGAVAPSGWKLCDGSAISRTTYSALFTVLSTTFGVGDNSSTFNLPDLRGRSAIGTGTGIGGQITVGTGAPTGGSALTARTLGQWTGEETHILGSTEESASMIVDRGTTAHISTGLNFIIPDNTDDWKAGPNVNGGNAHNNIQPCLVLNFIIKF